MWEKINEKFKKYPARMKVAEKMIELGLSLNNDGKIYCGNLKIHKKRISTKNITRTWKRNYYFSGRWRCGDCGLGVRQLPNKNNVKISITVDKIM